MLNWASRLGLIQRILCLLIGSALLTVLVVAWSLNELALLRGYIVAERAAEHRREIIDQAASLSYRAASKFAAVGLDLHPEEQRQYLLEGDAMLREFEAKQPILRAAMQDSLSQAELQVLDRSIASIRHSWDDVKQKMTPKHRDELQFHLIVIAKETERVYQLIGKADKATKDESEESEEAFDEGMAETRSRILLALTSGLLLGLALDGCSCTSQ